MLNFVTKQILFEIQYIQNTYYIYNTSHNVEGDKIMVLPLLAAIIPAAAKLVGGLLGGNKSEETQNQQPAANQQQTVAQQNRDRLLSGLLNGQISPQQARAMMGMS